MHQHILSRTGRHADDQCHCLPTVVRTSALRLVAIVLCLAAIAAVGQRAQANVTLDGTVLLYATREDPDYYSENPFTSTNDGIPLGGNIIEGFRALQQVRFEGRADDMGTPDTADDQNINFHVLVGRAGDGQMSILGGSDLRDMDLVIGDIDTFNGQTVRGTGTVRIDGEGSLYNSNPFIIPFAGLPPPYDYDPDNPIISVNPRLLDPDMDMGFDLVVGRRGIGALYITAGGRAEIQDAVLVGSASGSVGTLTVDGIGSFLGSGGFEADSGVGDIERHEMIIGRLGSGTMHITNGGTVYALAPMEMNQMETVVAAVIGSNRPFRGSEIPELGGIGTVSVDGVGSNWVVGGTLQIGGFHQSINPVNGLEDMEGDDAFYPASSGLGTLNIANGGLVSVVSPIPAGDDDQPDPNQITQLDVVIGQLGKLQLQGGHLDIRPASSAGGQTASVLDINDFRLVNDGLVTGHGEVSVGQFRNRALGKVRVAAGQTLVVTASGRFDVTLPDDDLPMQNFGLIEVIGSVESRAELEFVRVAGVSPNLPNEPTTPFLNQRQGTVTGNGGRSQGDIFAQHATLRFNSGLENHGNLTFTAGDNIVAGDVVNETDGVVFIDGNNTTVTFEDSIFNSGTFEIGPNASIVTSLVDATLVGSGSLSLTLGGSGNGQQVSHLSVVGDLMLDGLLEISLFPGATNPFSPQGGDTFEIMRAVGEMTGDFAAISLPFVSPTVGLFAFPDYALDAYFVTTLAAMPGSGSADLNGDGVVNDIDLAIWEQNLGNPGGLGDINGDGIVDGQDFFIWLMQASGFPGAAAGGGALAGGGFGGAVPEPSSLALLAIGGLLALAPRRRGGVCASTPGQNGRAI